MGRRTRHPRPGFLPVAGLAQGLPSASQERPELQGVVDVRQEGRDHRLEASCCVVARRQRPRKATRILITCARKACEKAAPLKKRDAFEEFFWHGARAPMESVQDFIARRETEYEKMTVLSPDNAVAEGCPTLALFSEEASHETLIF